MLLLFLGQLMQYYVHKLTVVYIFCTKPPKNSTNKRWEIFFIQIRKVKKKNAPYVYRNKNSNSKLRPCVKDLMLKKGHRGCFSEEWISLQLYMEQKWNAGAIHGCLLALFNTLMMQKSSKYRDSLRLRVSVVKFIR